MICNGFPCRAWYAPTLLLAEIVDLGLLPVTN